MSYVRINRRPVRAKKASASKKEWVSTVTDLSVHKPSSEELTRRHEMHKSRNQAAARWELREKATATRTSRSSSPPGLDRTRLRLFREMFSDQCRLHDVLERSDRTLAAVKDLFGDAPCRQTGFPRVTMAPGCESDSDLPVLQKADAPTPLSLLSQCMMDREALNDLDDSVGEHRAPDQADLASFNTELPRPKRKTCRARPPGGATNERRKQQNLPAASSDQLAALNATAAVQRVQPDADTSTGLVTQVLNPASSHSGWWKSSRRDVPDTQPDASGRSSGSQSSLELLQGMLGQVEAELDGLGTPDTTGGSELRCARGLTGFSAALVSALGRVASHLRQKEEEAETERRARRRTEEELTEHRSLIDALTVECLTLREESAALQATLQGRVTELEQRLDLVILTMETERDRGEAPPTARGRVAHHEAPGTSGTPGSGSDFSLSPPSSFASLPNTVLPRPGQVVLLDQMVALTNQDAAALRKQSASPPAGHQSTQRSAHVDDSSVTLMEERLQELNRQSAAAQTKLLELIEQQQKNSSGISPILTHSSSNLATVAVRRTPEVSVSVLERGTNGTSSGETVSLQTVGLRQTSNSQGDHQREGGWFALATHVR